ARENADLGEALRQAMHDDAHHEPGKRIAGQDHPDGGGREADGVLAALFAVFPLLLAVQAGRISDRYGVRLPIALGGFAMAIGLLLPLVAGGLPALFLCPALLGLGHIYFHVSVHNPVGSLGTEAERTKNFSTLALGGP